MTTAAKTIHDFITAHDLRMTVKPLANRSDRSPGKRTPEEEKWDREASHWECTLQIGPYDYKGTPRMVHKCEYSRGSAHRRFKAKHTWSGDYVPEERYVRSKLGNPVGKDVPLAWWGNPRGTDRPNLLPQYLALVTEGKPPETADVLDALASDAQSYDSARDFEDFCGQMGADTDSRRMEAMYKACGDTAKALRFMLGTAAYETLCNEIERL